MLFIQLFIYLQLAKIKLLPLLLFRYIKPTCVGYPITTVLLKAYFAIL